MSQPVNPTSTTSTFNGPAPYIGRFAPSPSGPLHFGSLVSAVASYLDARNAGGQWRVRMENLDPPREQPGADALILSALEQHGLHWDGAVLYQSERVDAYSKALDALYQQQLAYPCDCTRKDVRAMGGRYDGRCRSRTTLPAPPYAWRMKVYGVPGAEAQVAFTDLFQGHQTDNLQQTLGDPIIKRKDGLFAYQLAVVLDDIEQRISHIIRGSDLLDTSACQINMFRLLGATPPQFGHVPVAVNALGQKLSKQHHAPALNPDRAGANLWQALHFLRQSPPSELAPAGPAEVLDWAQAHWNPDAIVGLSGETPEPELAQAAQPPSEQRSPG